MGVDTRKPPLPAPTESWADNNSAIGPTDVATDVSRRTDRTSYSIPEDGSPITISTKKLQLDRPGGPGVHSQTSLLIEYYEGGKSSKDKSRTRPSVRVKVTPSSKKVKNTDALKITEIGTDSKPSYTRRISLGLRHDTQASAGTEASQSSGSNLSGRPPFEVEVLKNSSDLSSHSATQSRIVPVTSDVSTMPADSMLEGPVAFTSPERPRNRSLERDKLGDAAMDTLKAPSRRRSRSLSRERIAHKVIEKLANDRHAQDSDGRRRLQKIRSGKEYVEDDLKPRSHRSSRTYPESDVRSGTESSLMRAREGDSNVSGASKSSINNPKVLQAVEDAIRRLILPEIESIKRQQSSRYERAVRDSFASESSPSRTDDGRRISKASSATRSKPRVVLNRDGSESGIVLSGDANPQKKKRLSSRDSTSEKSTSRRESVSSASREQERERRHKHRDGHRTRDVAGEAVAAGLTTAALRSHESREHTRSRDKDGDRDKESRERKKRRSKTDSRTDSIAVTDEEYYEQAKIPALPMRSDVIDSDLTRESILSAETLESDRSASEYVGYTKTPIREVPRGLPQTIPLPESRATDRNPANIPLPDSRASVRTPANIPLPDSRASDRITTSQDLAVTSSRDIRPPGAATPRSSQNEKSISTRARIAGLVAAGLGGAATGAVYKQERHRDLELRSVSSNRTQKEQRSSPGRSATSSRKSVGAADFETNRSADSRAERSHLRNEYESTPSTPTAQFPLTQKRHQGINLEAEDDEFDARGASGDELEDGKEQNMDDFYNDQHRLNDEIRSGVGHDSKQDSSIMESEGGLPAREGNKYDASSTQQGAAQDVRGIGANPEVVRNPMQVESVVASLLEPSMISSARSAHPNTQRLSYDSSTYSTPGRALELENPIRDPQPAMLTHHENNSRDRWSMLKQSAKALSNDSREGLESASPERDVTRSLQSVEDFEQTSPIRADSRGQIDREQNSRSNSFTNTSTQQSEEAHEGLLGYQAAPGGGWPHEPSPTRNKRNGFAEPENQANESGMLGMTTGLGIGASALGGIRRHGSGGRFEPSASKDVSYDQGMQQNISLGHRDQHSMTPTATNMRDEGYISAAQARTPDNITPLSFSKPPPRLFDEVDLTRNDPGTQVDHFSASKRGRFQNENSHQYNSPTFNAATGAGMNNIQSKDVVALMDHLTVRDGHRNARDTEILVTLVRSAADMRNSFDEIKKFIEVQNRINMQRTDLDADRTINKLLNSARPQPQASPRAAPRESDEFPTKKQNIFKRALKGLSSKSTVDLAKIEDMLMQLLDDVEGIKEAQGMSGQQPGSVRGNSLDSYERLRAAPESGYEPEGQAGTSSNRSGNLTMSPQSRQMPRMRSGYDARPSTEKRVSTVPESDENVPSHDENDDGMRTPTQADHPQTASYSTPPRHAEGLGSQNDMTQEGGDKNSKHKSISSSLWGIPRISRWSKTTTSSAPDDRSSMGVTAAARREVPYSEVSRSGSDLNVLPGEGAQYMPHEDDRLRSSHSSDRDYDEGIPRSPSPLIPGSSAILDDPKYQANRNSLTLQHPQPRQGSTRRHQNRLETEATAYGDSNSPPITPDSDAFGSAPSLGRFHGGVAAFASNKPGIPPANTTGVSSSPNTPGSRGVSAKNTSNANPQPTLSQTPSSPPRPLKIRDDGPLLPSNLKVPFSAYDYGDEYEDDEWHDSAIPLSRKRSPYSPGGLLAPIEERYSMEMDRSSLGYRDSLKSNRSRVRYSMVENEGMADVREEDEDGQQEDRSQTPRLSPRPAVGAAEAPVRKLTGPRDMPGQGGAQPPSAPSVPNAPVVASAAGLKGTVRRKPMRNSS